MGDSEAVFQGRLSDGTSAARRSAEVRINAPGISVRTGVQAETIWPWATLTVATPLTRGSDHVLLSSSLAPDTTLLVTDATFVKIVAERAPHLTGHAFGWRVTRPILAGVAALAVIAGGLWLGGVSPARGIAMAIPDSLRRSVGTRVIDAIAEGHGQCETAAGRAALDRLVARLAGDSEQAARYRVRVVDWKLINAFAAPGGQIVLTRGILGTARSADEIAGVLAHEMGHADALHPETAIIRTVGLYAAFELMTGGGGSTLGTVGLLLSQLQYSQAAERDADARATATLIRAKVSTAGLADFFRRLDAREQTKSTTGKHWDILRTHPRSRERADTVAKQQVGDARPALEAGAWRALQTMCVDRPSATTKPDPK